MDWVGPELAMAMTTTSPARRTPPGRRPGGREARSSAGALLAGDYMARLHLVRERSSALSGPAPLCSSLFRNNPPHGWRQTPYDPFLPTGRARESVRSGVPFAAPP